MEEKTVPVSLSGNLTTYLGIGLSFLSFAVPFSLGNAQMVTGPLVNAALIISAILLPGKYFLPIIILPSIAVLSRGLIFGPFTPFLAYFLPFIWLGNFALVYIMKKLILRISYFPALIVAASVKQIVLYTTASLYFHYHLIPKLFLQTMGIFQMETALIGGLLAYLLVRKSLHGQSVA